MKKMYLFILVVFMLLLPVTSSFAEVPGATVIGQQVLVPYALNTTDGHGGADLSSPTRQDSVMTFSIGAYLENGT